MIGWGETRLSLDAPFSDKLQFARMNVDSQVCEFSGAVMCATGQNGARVACIFDHGDPLFVENTPPQQPRFVQVGMASPGWGIRCESPGPGDRFRRLGHPEIANYLANLIAMTPR